MKGYMTTISIGSNGQLLVTVPKQMARIDGIGKGTKIKWQRIKGKLIGEVII